jgi:vacuolar-type H+-ATPase subunit H
MDEGLIGQIRDAEKLALEMTERCRRSLEDRLTGLREKHAEELKLLDTDFSKTKESVNGIAEEKAGEILEEKRKDFAAALSSVEEKVLVNLDRAVEFMLEKIMI